MDPAICRDIHDAVKSEPNYCSKKIPVQSALNISAWRKYEPIIVEKDETLVDQLECGFTMGIDRNVHIDVPVTNHPSAREHYKVIDDFLIKHHENNSILGPYRTNPFNVHVHPSPMQVVTNASGNQRAVLDMSYPASSSVNHAIPKTWTDIHGYDGEFKLPTHDNICTAALQVNDPVMFICDLRGYYMQIPSDWRDTPFMVISWRGALWLHRRLPFGCRSSCLHAQRVTDAVVLIFVRITSTHIDGYVDDFASIVARLRSAAAFAAFHALLDELGLLRSVEKDQHPDYIRIFLGLEYNLMDMIMTIPQDKVIRAVETLKQWLNRDKCTKTQTQSLLGHLNHLSAVVQAGRAFTAAIVDLLRSDSFPAIISPETKLDIEAWVNFLTSASFNRSCIIKSQQLVEPDELIQVAVNGQSYVIRCQDKDYPYQLSVDSPHVPHRAMYAVAVWSIVNDLCEVIRGKVVKVTVPTKVAALAVNRARTDVKVIRPLLREMWISMAMCDSLIKAVPQKSDNYRNLFSVFHDFKTVHIP